MIGVGYRHRTGTVFFTRNGRKLDEACFGLRYNLFPTIGANGPCQVHVNLGQMGKQEYNSILYFHIVANHHLAQASFL